MFYFMYFQNGRLLPTGTESTFQIDTRSPLSFSSSTSTDPATDYQLSLFSRNKTTPIFNSPQDHLKEWEVENIVGERLLPGLINNCMCITCVF